MSRHLKKMNEVIKSTPEIEVKKQLMYVEVPYIEDATTELRNKLKHLCNQLRPDFDIQFFMKPPTATQLLFQIKDPIDKPMKADVVYSIKCSNCEHFYIGKTQRQCIRRLHEHGAPKHNTFDNNIVELRRYDRLNNKHTTTASRSSIITENKDGTKSAVKQHEEETGHRIDWKNFHVVTQDNHPYRLLIKESLLIKAYEPELNRTTHSVPLIVFPDGLPKTFLPRPCK